MGWCCRSWVGMGWHGGRRPCCTCEGPPWPCCAYEGPRWPCCARERRRWPCGACEGLGWPCRAREGLRAGPCCALGLVARLPLLRAGPDCALALALADRRRPSMRSEGLLRPLLELAQPPLRGLRKPATALEQASEGSRTALAGALDGARVHPPPPLTHLCGLDLGRPSLASLNARGGNCPGIYQAQCHVRPRRHLSQRDWSVE